MQAHGQTALSTALHSLKVWEQFINAIYSILKCTHLENFFHHINRHTPTIQLSPVNKLQVKRCFLLV